MAIPDRGTATVTGVQPCGFDRWTPEDDFGAGETVTRTRYWVTYRHQDRPCVLLWTANPHTGFAKGLADAVRRDIEARRYLDDPLDRLTLPLEVSL